VQELRIWDRRIVVVPTAVLISAIGGTIPSFSATATLIVLAVGSGMIWLGLSGQFTRRPAATVSRAAAWWALPVLVIALTELFSFLHGSRGDYPTVSALADPILAHYLPRAVGWFGWIMGFWGLMRR